jgi:hypothetical protein
MCSHSLSFIGGEQATVAAIGSLSDNSRMYASRPILISGTCKREAANSHANLISVVDAFETKSIKSRVSTWTADLVVNPR